jgi:hypothetical protein
VGIAAGFDKQAEAVLGLQDLGFGFVEVIKFLFFFKNPLTKFFIILKPVFHFKYRYLTTYFWL